MIDVHVARDLNDDLSWWEECETSLGFSQLINVHQISSVRGDIRNMRLVGFNQGMCEYVSFVDPDDVVLPDAFESLLAALIDNPRACGAYGLSMRIDDQGKERGLIHPYRKYSSSYLKNHPLEIHQLVVMRRNSVLDAMHRHYNTIPCIGLTEVALYALMALDSPWIAVNHVGYKWRIHDGGSHRAPFDWADQRELMKALCTQLTKQNK